jgi:hypothetical protein
MQTIVAYAPKSDSLRWNFEMLYFYLIIIVLVPVAICANLALWFFGVRPYIHRHGRACVTGANWGCSMWADMTTAYEIGKEEKSFALSLKWLFALQLIQILFVFLVVPASTAL